MPPVASTTAGASVTSSSPPASETTPATLPRLHTRSINSVCSAISISVPARHALRSASITARPSRRRWRERCGASSVRPPLPRSSLPSEPASNSVPISLSQVMRAGASTATIRAINSSTMPPPTATVSACMQRGAVVGCDRGSNASLGMIARSRCQAALGDDEAAPEVECRGEPGDSGADDDRLVDRSDRARFAH